MDKVNKVKDPKYIIYLSLVGVGIAALTSLNRADYNFVLYLYIIYVWKYADDKDIKQRALAFYIMIYSLIIDFVWCIYWGAKWKAFKKDPEGFMHVIVMILSILGILVKIALCALLGILNKKFITEPKNSLLKEQEENIS